MIGSIFNLENLFGFNIFTFGVGFAVIFLVISLAFFALWIAMLVDCAKRKFKKVNERVAWFLVLAIFGAVGGIVYYFAVKRNKNY